MKTKCLIISVLLTSLIFSCAMNGDDNKPNEPKNSEKTSEATSETPAEKINAKSPAVSANRMLISPDGSAVTFTCTAESSDGSLSYQWYTSTDGAEENKSAIEGATSATYTTEAFTQKEIRYYFCTVTNTISDNGDKGNKTASQTTPFYAAYTGLPVIEIETVDKEEPTADYVSPPAGCYGGGLKNATKVPGQMKIIKDGVSIYNSGSYVKKQSGITIKLRGNTSAYSAKKPYKIKLQKKADLLDGLVQNRDSNCKDKDWILLKDATSLNTFVGMTVADILGTPWTPEFAFVDVVLNGDYKGVYLLIEAISQNVKRINVADDGYIIERDAYWWNEDVKFITPLYNQKYTFKYPDEEDVQKDESILTYIENYMNNLEQNVQAGNYEDYLDVESFARWLLIHDILGTWDAGGSNVYIYKYDSTENSKIFMATTWDYDSNYCMKDSWANQHNGDRIYADPMFKSDNPAFKNSYKTQWKTISSTLWPELLTKLEELNSLQGEDINLSRKCDAYRWNGTSVTVTDNIKTAEDWFVTRTSWLNMNIYKL